MTRSQALAGTPAENVERAEHGGAALRERMFAQHGHPGVPCMFDDSPGCSIESETRHAAALAAAHAKGVKEGERAGAIRALKAALMACKCSKPYLRVLLASEEGK